MSEKIWNEGRMNQYNLRDTVYCALATMPATCTCDSCGPRVEALLVSLMNNVDKWLHLDEKGIGPNATYRMDRAATNAANTLNQLRRLTVIHDEVVE